MTYSTRPAGVSSYLEVEEGREGPDGHTPAESEAVVVGGEPHCELPPHRLVQGADVDHHSAHLGVAAQPPVRQLQVQPGADLLLPVVSAGVAVVQLAEVAGGPASRVQSVHGSVCKVSVGITQYLLCDATQCFLSTDRRR